MTISVLIADDHAFTLDGMQRAVAAMPECDVVATVSGGVQAVASARALAPDIVVLDFSMPDITGLEAMSEIRRWSPQVRFVIVTGSTAPLLLQQIHSAGVEGLFLKASDPDLICDGILRVAQGETVRGPGLPAFDQQRPTLSDRETEVLFGISRGQSNPQIAKSLSISPKTVESHRSSLMRKLKVRSTAALLVQAVRDGILDP